MRRSLHSSRFILPFLAFLSCPGSTPVDFDRDIRPVLSDHCYACHGPDREQRKAKLRLDTREGLLGGPFVPGRPDESPALARIGAEDPEERMPPPGEGRPLSPEQIRLLRRWVAEGAEWKGHWAFEPVRAPEPPPSAGWGRNAIDRFVGRRLEQASLSPEPEAERSELIRRAWLDLLGLPPPPAAVTAFVEDPLPYAWERLLDRLFASPHYGERMVWEWLDAARYADSNGYQGDQERTMWPWRDWAIDALNRNMPFDEFTLWQLAGDLLPGATEEQILATGFLRNHMINGEGGRIAEENRVDYVMDMAETTGTVWLGLTFNCCRCHDHKFDPVGQDDYYRFFAFFNQTPVDGGGGNPQTPPVLEVPDREQERLRTELATIRKELESALRESEQALDPDSLPEEIAAILRTGIGRRKIEQLETLARLAEERGIPWDGVELADVRRRERSLQGAIPRVMVMKEREEPRSTFILARGLYNQPGEEVEAGTPEALPAIPERVPRNRLGLAQWITAPGNPLTARVFVNRQWALFFGRGLVDTPEDFGTQGSRPTHPELLDWLSRRFMESGWNVKRLQRLILESATWRQSSRAGREKRERDPDNRLLSRGPRHRLPSWMIRDQALAASELWVEEMGGAPVRPYQPEGVWAEFTFGKKNYRTDTGAALYRRSVYTFWRRIIGPTMLFDSASRQICTVRPRRTSSPLHALVTLNGTGYLEASRALAVRVLEQAESAGARLDLAFGRMVGRRPDAGEREILLTRLEEARRTFAEEPGQARSYLSIGQHRPDPPTDPVELAAWTFVCHLILNLDETLTKQ